jgi:hypothetical protein
MIKIIGQHFYSDDTQNIMHEIDDTQIFGFELHYRGENSWHIVVKVKQTYHYGLDFEIEHRVDYWEMVKFLQNPIATSLVREIINYHNSDDFYKELKDLILKAHSSPVVNKSEVI